jgi:hypothetical protein
VFTLNLDADPGKKLNIIQKRAQNKFFLRKNTLHASELSVARCLTTVGVGVGSKTLKMHSSLPTTLKPVSPTKSLFGYLAFSIDQSPSAIGR